MKKATIWMALSALVVALSAGAAVADPPWGGKGRGGKGMGPHMMMKALDLTAEQQQQVEALRDDFDQVREPLREQVQAKKTEMWALWKVESPDRDAILAKHAEIDAIKRQLREAKVDFRLAVHGLLTAEQRAKAAEMMERRGGKRGKRGMRGDGCRGPGCGFGPPGADE
jgi:Spy/CpxP family protein refolding chaperone